MNQAMKTNDFFAIKINAERILIAILVFISIIFIVLYVNNNAEVNQLKFELRTQQSLNLKLDGKIKDIEYQNDDLENRIDNLESNYGNIVVYRY